MAYSFSQKPDEQLGELSSLQGQIPALFDTTELKNQYQSRIASMLSSGRIGAQNAARQFGTQQLQTGGNPALGGVVRAQALVPYYKQAQQLEGDLADKTLQSKQAQGSLQANVAQALGQLRVSYLNSLMGYDSAEKGRAQQQTQFGQSMALDRQKLAQQQSQFGQSLSADQSKTNAALALQRDELAQKANQFNQTLGQQQYQFNYSHPSNNMYGGSVTPKQYFDKMFPWSAYSNNHY